MPVNSPLAKKTADHDHEVCIIIIIVVKIMVIIIISDSAHLYTLVSIPIANLMIVNCSLTL